MYSQADWKGSSPCRFSGGRIHKHPQDSLSLFMKQSYPSSKAEGLKTYQSKPTPQQQFVPSLKVYNEQMFKVTYQLPPKGIKLVQPFQQKERIRPQKKHVQGGQQSSSEVDYKGIKTFNQANKSRNVEYLLENKMQRKHIVGDLQTKRNNLNVTSLGDKAYKYPQYAVDFYKAGGLIPGSTNSYHGKKSDIDKKITGVLTKPNWDVRVKMDQQAQDKRVLNSVDEWQQSTLKQANPNWNDPDTFFEREQAKAQGGKDQKKGAKK